MMKRLILALGLLAAMGSMNGARADFFFSPVEQGEDDKPAPKPKKKGDPKPPKTPPGPRDGNED